MDDLSRFEGKIIMPVNQIVDMESAYRKAGLHDEAQQLRDTFPVLFPSQLLQ